MYTRLILLSFFLFSFISCDKEIKSNIPDIKFQFQESILAAPFYQLTTPDLFFTVDRNYKGYTLGYAGLILGQSLWGGYIAYDQACPVEAHRSIKVRILADKDDEDVPGQMIAKCDECGTRFLLNSVGAPIGNKDVPALKRYTVVVNGDKVIVYH